MRNTILFVATLIIFCILCLTDVHAQAVYGYSDITYDESTNSMVFTVTAEMDYSTEAYYCLNANGNVFVNDDYPYYYGETGCTGYTIPSTVRAVMTLPYDPDATYSLETLPSLDTYMRLPDEEDGGSIYVGYDPFNYARYDNGNTLYHSLFYSFFASGNPRRGIYSIFLGVITSAWSSGGASGPPSRLKVLTDRSFTESEACGRVKKEIVFQAVDDNNRAVGRINLSEEPKNITDSCSGLQVLLNPCSSVGVSPQSIFIDNLRTGCPESGTPSANCGYDFGNKWQWCDTTMTSFIKNLAFMYYDVRHSYIKVDGELDIQDGTYKYP